LRGGVVWVPMKRLMIMNRKPRFMVSSLPFAIRSMEKQIIIKTWMTIKSR